MSYKPFPYSPNLIWLTAFIVVAGLALHSGCSPLSADSPPAPEGKKTDISAAREGPPPATRGIGRDPIWDDGLSEMSYFAATDRIYDQERHYTRVVLINREWLDPIARVKTEPTTMGSKPQEESAPIAVLKMNVAEEIPTENYNYRVLMTVFLHRDSLSVEKVSASCQEWCGATFSQWLPIGGDLQIRSFSYFNGEADETYQIKNAADIYPPEALLILARDLIARPRPFSVRVSPKIRLNHAIKPEFQRLSGIVEPNVDPYSCKAGRFSASSVIFRDDRNQHYATLIIESSPPHRLLAYRFEDGATGRLEHVERRAYWDRGKSSRYYQQGAAP